jgi:hypothetical protein
MTPLWERFPSSERLCVNVILRCNLTCAHCNVGSHPQREERLSSTYVEELLAAGWAVGKRHVTFSGGEPFLERRSLQSAVGAAGRLGYAIDVETNAFWARTPMVATTLLRPMRDAGLQGLVLSADAFHADVMPLEKTVNAGLAAKELGLLVEVNFCPSTDPVVDGVILATLERAGFEVIRNPLLAIGRAANEFPDAPATIEVAQLPDCDSLTTTVHADGTIFSCCEIDDRLKDCDPEPIRVGGPGNPGEALLRARPLGRVLEAFYEPASPVYFKKLVNSSPLFSNLVDGRYTSICHFCRTCFAEPERLAFLESVVGAGDAKACSGGSLHVERQSKTPTLRHFVKQFR